MAKPETDKDFNRRLARRVATYWREQGHFITVDVHPARLEDATMEGLWGLTSNLVNGLPPTYRKGNLHV